MSLLTPQTKDENAAPAVPRTGLPSSNQSMQFRAAPRRHALRNARQNGDWERFGTGASKQTDDANDAPEHTGLAGLSPRKHFPQGRKPLQFQCS
jgi:hypothetical protein